MFLLFMIGLELSFERLWSMRRLVFGLGGAQVVVTGAVITGIAMWFGNPPPQAIVIGTCLALSSTAIVMRLLTDARRLGTPVGRVSFGILLFQDLAVVPILFLVGVLGAETEGPVLPAFLVAVGKAIVAIGLILLLGRTVIRPSVPSCWRNTQPGVVPRGGPARHHRHGDTHRPGWIVIGAGRIPRRPPPFRD